MFFAGLAGYVAARLAGRSPRGHSAAVGVLIAAGAVIAMLNRRPGSSSWLPLMALVLMAPSALLCGLLHGQRAPEPQPGPGP
jgi:hypothetical protein